MKRILSLSVFLVLLSLTQGQDNVKLPPLPPPPTKPTEAPTEPPKTTPSVPITTPITPGLGFIPRPPESNVESTLIWYNPDNYTYWTDQIDSFLQAYKTSDSTNENRVMCTYDYGPRKGQVCDVDISWWGPCVSKQHYNNQNFRPCIFLKLDKILGWAPLVYNDTYDLPADMPAHMQDHIKDRYRRDKNTINAVWVDCEGENPVDIENIGPISYYPDRAFPAYYFPFENLEGYLSPLVAVRFENPKRGVLMNIVCKAWAQNIHRDRYERRGAVHFELMVD